MLTAVTEAHSSRYQPFAPFSAWADLGVGSAWAEFFAALEVARGKAAAPEREAALSLAVRSAALETGAIEGLYSTNRGITQTVALQSGAWETELEKLGSDVRGHFDAQLAAFDLVLDAAARTMPISEAWLRELHSQVCSAQVTYKVWTDDGWQERRLPHGDYKTSPNNVTLADGTTHWYAAVHDVPAEMHRLVTEMQSDQFRESHAVIQAAFAHHGLTSVHPFADGNGRTARALASVFLHRAAGVPLVIFSDQRQTYFDALQDADAGRYLALMTFVDDRAMDTMAMVTDHLRDALHPLDQQVASIRKRLLAHGGLTHGEVQAVAWRLRQRLEQAFNENLGELGIQQHDVHWRADSQGLGSPLEGTQVTFEDQPYHALPEGGRVFLSLTCYAPLRVEADTLIAVGTSDQTANPFAFIVAGLPQGTAPLKLRIADLHPAISAAAEARIEGWTRGVISDVLDGFYARIDRALREQGFE